MTEETQMPEKTVRELISDLDKATAATCWAQDQEHFAFEAVLSHPDNTWDRSTLAYRRRQLFYK